MQEITEKENTSHGAAFCMDSWVIQICESKYNMVPLHLLPILTSVFSKNAGL